MAEQTKMGRVFFALYRNTTDDATRAKDDPVGVFSCMEWAAKFLDIEQKSFTGIILIKRKAGNRTLVRADGSSLKVREGTGEGTEGGTGGTVSSAVETEIAKQFKAGGRAIKIITGKKIEGKNSNHTLFFSFPTWATIPVISDALGELIPATKMKASPTATDIYPYFVIPGGGKYGIMSNTEATQNTDASTDQQTVAAQIQANGGKIKEGAK
jgi:hypothetical protein